MVDTTAIQTTIQTAVQTAAVLTTILKALEKARLDGRPCRRPSMQTMVHANDHLDGFFNAAIDAGIALQAFIAAAERIGLGCCPLSVIRNQIARVSDLLALPDG